LPPGTIRGTPTINDGAMPKRPLFKLLAAILPALVLGACEREAGTVEVPTRVAPADPADRLSEIPREELYGASAVENLWSPRVELDVPDLPRGWDGATIAIVSDMQIGRWEENAQVAAAAIQKAIDADADLIVLLGDFLAQGGSAGELAGALRPLQGRRAVAVLGSGDVRSDSVEALVTSTLRAAGATVLNTEAVLIEIGGDSAPVAGLHPDLVRMTWADQQWVLATIAEGSRIPLLISHNPAMAARAPQGRFPVTVGGNVFCGQVEIAGTPRFAWLRDEIFPGGLVEGTDRLFRVMGGTVVVSCGLGYSFVPIRFGAAPEVPLLTLRRFAVADDAPADAPAGDPGAEELLEALRQPPTEPETD
jgi:uncharacterized protein